jgi:LPPG:FO 2-phospho-L-lactate transferase
VSIGTILAVPGLAAAVRDTAGAVVGVSPIVGGAPVRGMADRLLPVIDVDVSAEAVGRHYGARSAGGLLDGWLVDDSDSPEAAALTAEGLPTVARPLLMSGPDTTAAIALAVLDLAAEVQR